MTAPSVAPEIHLDEQTKAELRPVCDITTSVQKERCDKPATWLMLAGCSSCKRMNRRRRLICDEHASYLVGRGACWCQFCKVGVAAEIVSLEPLR